MQSGGEESPESSSGDGEAEEEPQRTEKPLKTPPEAETRRLVEKGPHEARIRESDGKSEAAEKSSETGEKWQGCSGEKRDEGVEDAEGGAEPWGAGAARSARDGGFKAIEDGHGVDLEAA